MTTFITGTAKKRTDLTKSEKALIKNGRQFQKILKKEWAHQRCDDFMWDCPACKHDVFFSLLDEFLYNEEFV